MKLSLELQRLGALLLLYLSIFVTATANYTVSGVSGDVKLKHLGKFIDIKKDMEIGVADIFIIGEGGEIEIFDSRDSRLYKVDNPGEYSVTGIMLAANKQAKSNGSAIHGKLRLSKGNTSESTVYIEKGKVTRALSVYDPSGDNIQVDPAMIGSIIGNALRESRNQNSDSSAVTSFPLPLTHAKAGNDGLRFELENNLTFPVYFNVVKLNAQFPDSVEISQLGQPVGCYVVLPNQSLMREQSSDLPESERHIIVMTHYYFDIDKVIEAICNSIKEEDNAVINPDVEYPVYLQFL